MEDASLSNCFQVNDHQGNWGPKDSWGNVRECVRLYQRCMGLCDHRSERVFVLQTVYERWKYGRERRGLVDGCGLVGGKPGTP